MKLLSPQECVLLKTQAKAKKQEQVRQAVQKAVVEDIVSMQTALSKFSYVEYQRSKFE